MPDRRTPLHLPGEKRTLQEFLDCLREPVILKVIDLDEASARRSTVPTGTSLPGLLKHLTGVERFQFASFSGSDAALHAEEIQPTDCVVSAVAAYRAATWTKNEIVDACDDLDQLCVRALTTPERLSLRWLLVHRVEETAWHAGHADILREQIDGLTGR